MDKSAIVWTKRGRYVFQGVIISTRTAIRLVLGEGYRLRVLSEFSKRGLKTCLNT